MTTALTDPARELAELCQSLCNTAYTASGESFLAGKFGVEVGSRDFYQILFSILDRVKLVESLILDLDLDTDLKSEAKAHAAAFASAFGSVALRNGWHNHGAPYLAPDNVQPIKMLSTMVRQRLSYPKLSLDDVAELQAELAELLGWLNQHQIAEQDFIRQALIEGLEQFMFRLEKLEWFGYGYTVASLREVIAAYMALERAVTDPATQPDAAAVLQKTAAVIKSVYSRITVAKGVYEAGDFMLKAYGAVSLAMKAYPGIAGLLPGS